jgi:predicted aconitase with swiveling domain
VSDDSTESFAVVTFAIYDEAPIACQGDDDIKKVRVIKDRFIAGHDVHGDALRLSVVMGAECGSYVQVWDVQVIESAKESGVRDGSLG